MSLLMHASLPLMIVLAPPHPPPQNPPPHPLHSFAQIQTVMRTGMVAALASGASPGAHRGDSSLQVCGGGGLGGLVVGRGSSLGGGVGEGGAGRGHKVRRGWCFVVECKRAAHSRWGWGGGGSWVGNLFVGRCFLRFQEWMLVLRPQLSTMLGLWS